MWGRDGVRGCGGHCACGRQRGGVHLLGGRQWGRRGSGGALCDGQRGESVGVPGVSLCVDTRVDSSPQSTPDLVRCPGASCSPRREECFARARRGLRLATTHKPADPRDVSTAICEDTNDVYNCSENMCR